MSTLPTSSRGSLHTVLGSTGGVGNALVRELVQRGYRVRAVSRSGVSNDVSAPVEAVAADLTTPTAVRAATAASPQCSG